MIVDIRRFIEKEKPSWEEIETVLNAQDEDPARRMSVEEIRRFHYLYERVSSDLTQIATFAAERDTRRYLETLVARAYGRIHEIRRSPTRFRPVHWFFQTFPQTFRRHIRAFYVSATILLTGSAIGAVVLALDPASKDILIPIPEHVLQNPADRVAREEQVRGDQLKGRKAQGAAFYMTNNTGVAINTLALGATWGIGTAVMLFYTGIMIGAISLDYIAAGQTRFLLGWLLPHGSVEIPAILLAGQAGFVLAAALIGWGRKTPLRQRLRESMGDLVTLIFGVAILLIWAGIVEAYISQYHQPTLPYSLKIGLGCVELVLLAIFLSLSGRSAAGASNAAAPVRPHPSGPPV